MASLYPTPVWLPGVCDVSKLVFYFRSSSEAESRVISVTCDEVIFVPNFHCCVEVNHLCHCSFLNMLIVRFLNK